MPLAAPTDEPTAQAGGVNRRAPVSNGPQHLIRNAGKAPQIHQTISGVAATEGLYWLKAATSPRVPKSKYRFREYLIMEYREPTIWQRLRFRLWVEWTALLAPAKYRPTIRRSAIPTKEQWEWAQGVARKRGLI